MASEFIQYDKGKENVYTLNGKKKCTSSAALIIVRGLGIGTELQSPVMVTSTYFEFFLS